MADYNNVIDKIQSSFTVDLSGDGLTVTITPSIDREPKQGENVTYRCEIQENEIYMKPVWRDEVGNIINTALPGRFNSRR